MNKVGFRKRTLAEWTAQVKEAAIESEGFFNTIKNTATTAFTVPKQKIELIKEDDFQTKFGATAEEFFKEFNLNFNDGSVTKLTEFIEEMNVVDETMQSFLQDTMQEQASATYEAYAEYVREANEENQSFADTIKGGLKAGITSLANGLLDAAIGWVVEKGIEKIDYLIHEAEYAKEAMEAAMETIAESQDELKNVTDTVNSNKDRFIELSQGVDQFSYNLSLSDDDYSEFLSISQELAAIAPELISGYDEQGNALLRLGENAKETEEILNRVIEAQREETNQVLIDNMDDIAKGVKVSVREIENEIDNLELKLADADRTISLSTMDIADTFLQGEQFTYNDEEYKKYGKKLEKALKKAGVNYNLLDEGLVNSNTIEFGFDETATKKNIEKAQKYYDEFMEGQKDGYSAEEAELKKSLVEKEKLVDEHYTKMNAGIKAWVENNDDYKDLKDMYDGTAGIVDALVPEIKWSELEEAPKNAEDYQEYIQKNILNPLNDIPEGQKKKFSKKFQQLLDFEDGNLEIVSFAEKLQKKLDKEYIHIDISPIFADEKEAYDRLQNSIEDIATRSGKAAKKNVKKELKELGKDGTVNLTLRPEVDTSLLNEKGWDAGEGTATVFSSTFSNEDNTKAINFTPIIADPNTGEYLGCLTPDELSKYAEGVIAGVKEDDLNLQIGAVYEGKDAIQQAEKDAIKIHDLHEQYFTNDIGKTFKNTTLTLLQEFTKNFSAEDANRWETMTLGSKSYYEAIAKYLTTLQTDYSSTLDEIDTSVISLSESQELLNSALAEQAENGTLSQNTIATLKEKYSDLSKVLEITANGVIINKNKLAELNTEEEKLVEKDIASTREKLVEQFNANSLAIAGYKMQLEDTSSIADDYKAQLEATLSLKEADQEKTKEQIAQLDLLGVEYDSLTSKTNKFLQSLSTADDGNIYDSVHSALEQVKEVYDKGDYGKDEFRNFVDYMTYEDMSGASTEEIKANYEVAMKTGEKYFKANNKGLNNFLKDMEKYGMAIQDANGNWKINIESVDTLAKKMNISADAAQDILNKFKDKGWEINFATSDEGLIDVEAELNTLEKRLKKLKKEKRLKLDADLSTEEVDKKIKKTKKAIKDIKANIQLNIDTQNAKAKILELQIQIDSLDKNKINAATIKDLEKQQKELAEKYNIDLVALIDTTKVEEKVKETKEKAEETTTYELDANTDKAEKEIDKIAKKIDKIFKKTYKLKVGIAEKGKIKNIIKNSKKDETEGDSEANGTAITGKAYANGKRGKIAAGYSSKSLVGELGPEMRVRDGKYEILGQNGAEFTDVRPDDIIFNAKQTEEILKKGKTNPKGNAYEGGTNTGVTGSGSNLETHTTSKSKKEEKKKKSSSKDTDTTKFQEAIDWCTETINKLTGIIDNINAKLNSTTASLKSQIANYKKLLSQQQALINGYEKTKKVRTSEYKKSLSKLSKEDRKKVEDGTYTIEQFTGKAKSGKTSKEEKRHNNIQDAIEARDAMISADTDLINAKQEFQEYAEAMAAIRWEKATEKVEKLNGELDLLELKETNANGYKAKNALVDEQLATQKKNVKIQRKAVAQTDKDADKYYKKISKENRKNVNADGTIKTKGITDKKELKNIKIYNAYVKQSAQNTLELAKAEEELKASKKEAILTKAQNIQDEYDMKVGEYEARINRIQDKVSLVEAQGNIVGKTYYTSMIASTKTSLALKEDELELLQTQLENAKYGTEEWYELSQKVSDCASETDNLKASTEEWNTTMQEIETSAFDDLIAKFQKLNDEADFYIKLMESSGDLFDEDGNMTELGTAKLGLLYGKYNTSQNEGEEAGKKAERYSSFLTEAEKNGKVTIDDTTYSLKQLKEKIASLKEAQQDAILSTIDYRDEIYDFIEEGINAEIEAYEELIEKKKEALDVNEELYEFQKKMTESSKDIALIQRQLAALEGDNSDEARKKRRELEVQLSDAEESHQELVKEQSITMQSEALDEALENFKADMEKRLEELKENKDLTEVSKTVNANLPGISETLNKILTKVGYNEDDDTKKIFNSGNGGTVESNVDNVTNNYITEAEKEKKEADEKAKSDVSNVTNETSTVGLEEVIDKEQESQQIAEQQKEEAQKALASQIESVIKSGTFRDLVDVDSKDKKGKYKYNKVNRYLIKQHGYSINDKKQARIAKLLGMSGATENNISNDAKQTKLLKKLKNAGFSTGGMVKVDDLNSIVKANGDDGIATVKKDEYVLTPVQTQSFIDLAKLSPDLLQASNTLIDGLKFNPTIPLASGTQLQNIDASVNIQVQGNADATTVKDIRKIAEDVVAKQQKEIQRQAYNRGMRLR